MYCIVLCVKFKGWLSISDLRNKATLHKKEELETDMQSKIYKMFKLRLGGTIKIIFFTFTLLSLTVSFVYNMDRTTIRSKPDYYDRDEDLEQLQRDFMNSNQVSSASVSRKAPPSFTSANKKPSLFAQRRAAAASAAATPSTDPPKNKPGITIADLAKGSSCAR